MSAAPENILSQLLKLWNAAENLVISHPEIAGFGVLSAALAVLWLVFSFLRIMWGMARMAHISGTAAQIRRGSEIGSRVLIARGVGKHGGAISEFLSETARTHLKTYMFGGPFDVIEFPAKVKSSDQARSLLQQSGADLILWGDGRNRKQPHARILKLEDADTPHDQLEVSYVMPRQKSDWSKALSRALAYGAARQLRPALARPQDFRAERLTPVVETLEGLVASEVAEIDPRLEGAINDDFAAGALQMALAGNEQWQARIVDIQQKSLDGIDRADAPDRWVDAKIRVGRALQIASERNFDPVQLQKAVSHLTDALEALRSEPRFRTAETAAKAIADCQKMIGTRRRFSITQGGI